MTKHGELAEQATNKCQAEMTNNSLGAKMAKKQQQQPEQLDNRETSRRESDQATSKAQESRETQADTEMDTDGQQVGEQGEQNDRQVEKEQQEQEAKECDATSQQPEDLASDDTLLASSETAGLQQQQQQQVPNNSQQKGCHQSSRAFRRKSSASSANKSSQYLNNNNNNNLPGGGQQKYQQQHQHQHQMSYYAEQAAISDQQQQVPVSADYLAQLIKDKKQLAAFPSMFLHVQRLVDDEIGKVRQSLFQLSDVLVQPKEPLQLPEPEGELAHLQEKLYVPVDEHPEYNFVGRLLGPRGMTAKQLEQETGCKIMIRGRGSMRDKKKEEQNRGKANWEHLNDDLHVLISVEDTETRAYIKMQRALEEVRQLLVPVVCIN